jgi:PKD repeat protein
MENATIVYQDNIAVTYLIGVNTDCAGPTLCETAFIPVYTSTPGHVEFINNSIYTGNAEFLWDYGNGQFSNDFSGNVQYESNGVYSVCLTITTVNCTYSTCQVVVIDNMENACSFNEVTLVVEANYFDPIFEEVFHLVIANGNFPVQDLTFIPNGNFSDTLGFCLPDGCYEVTLYSELPIQAMSFIGSFSGENTQQLGELQLMISEATSTCVIGVNMDCTIDVQETNAKAVRAFPNPASNYIQFASQESIQLLEIFDMTGKRVASFNPNQLQVQINTSNWSSGLYVAHVIGSEKMERAIFEIAR